MHQNWILFKSFFLAGAFTFTGGMGMIPMLYDEFVTKNKLIDEELFYHYMALAQTFPGVIAITSACFLGKKVSGYKGMLIGGIAVIIPAFFTMLLLTMGYNLIPNNHLVEGIFIGIRASAGLFIFEAALKMGAVIIKDNKSKIIVVLTLILRIVFNISVIWIIAGCLAYAIALVLFHKE